MSLAALLDSNGMDYVVTSAFAGPVAHLAEGLQGVIVNGEFEAASTRSVLVLGVPDAVSMARDDATMFPIRRSRSGTPRDVPIQVPALSGSRCEVRQQPDREVRSPDSLNSMWRSQL